MNESGLVSVILPNRNHAHYLPRALGALLAQTWPRFEIIVVDDASNDDSRAVIADHARSDPRIRLFPMSEHVGVAGSIQRAASEARGEYVCLAAADDFVEPAFFERCVSEMSRFPDAGMCFSDPTEYRERENRRVHFPLYLSERPTYFDPRALAATLARNYFHISPNTGIYRTRAFREAGGYAADLEWFADWFLTMVVALRHGACYLPGQLTYVTMRETSYSTVNLRRVGMQRRLLYRVLDRLAEPRYADVTPVMRAAALVPEYRFRTLYWLARHRVGRTLLTPRLVGRTTVRATWFYVRPLAPVAWRRLLRKRAGARS